MRLMQGFAKLALGQLFGLWLFSGSVHGCPYCNIFNYLDQAVTSAQEISICTIIRHVERDMHEVRIEQVIRGDSKPGSTASYASYTRDPQAAGTTVIALGRTNAMPVTDVLLPVDLLTEVLRLLLKTIEVRDPDDAALLLTSLSPRLHYAAASYYKAFPDEVQEALLKRLNKLAGQTPNGPWYRTRQLEFALIALMRHRSVVAEMQVIRECDDWIQSSAPSPGGADVHPQFVRFQTILGFVPNANSIHLRPLVEGLLNSVDGAKLAELCRGLITSGMMMPNQLLRHRSDEAAAAFVEHGIIQAAWDHLNVWNWSIAAKLYSEAARIDRPEMRTELERLESALKPHTPALRRSPASDGSWDAGLGIGVESVLTYDEWWDQVEPLKPPMPLRLRLSAVTILFLLPLYIWFRHVNRVTN